MPANLSPQKPGTSIRLKISYFCDKASARLGRSVYELAEKDQAFNIVHKIHTFASSHYWLSYMTLKSAHREEATRWIKVMLGNKLMVIFVDVTLANRTRRFLVSLAELKKNDLIKCSRGADGIKNMADIVLDNNRPFEETLRELNAFLA